jgi:hypothetical protein
VVLWERGFGGLAPEGGDLSVSATVFSSKALSIPRVSNGALINSSELCSLREKRPE